MSDESETLKDALIKAAWDRWFEEDYSWEALKLKPAKWDGDDGSGSVYANLQDYWLTDPDTGNIRSENDLFEIGELIRVPGQKTYHIIHLPIHYEDGSKTIKFPNNEVNKLLDFVIESRIKASGSNPDDNVETSKAFLQGGVFLDIDFSKKGFTRRESRLWQGVINAEFAGAIFLGFVCFDYAEFTSNPSFWDCRFIGEASFCNTIFNKGVNFNFSKFFDKAKFAGAKFEGVGNFFRSYFRGESFFVSAYFGNDATFYGSQFESSISFSGFVCRGRSSFFEVSWPEDSTKSSHAFRNSVFEQIADFTGAGFKAFAAFDGIHLKSGLRLDKVNEHDAKHQFITELNDILDYGGAEEKPRATIAKTRKGKVFAKRKKELADEKINARREAFLEQLESGCRALKLEMEKAADKNREQLLYRFELLARRAQDITPKAEKFFSWTYERFSDYGNSTARPIGWLFGLLLGLGVAAYGLDGWLGLLNATTPNVMLPTDKLPLIGRMIGPVGLAIPNLLQAQFHWDNLWSALSFSLGNTVHPLSVLSSENLSEKSVAYRLLTQYGEGYGFLVRVLASLQSILSIVLVFLFALAVRRRFQIS